MQSKQIFSIILIIFVLGSLAYMISKERKTESVPKEEVNASVPASQSQTETIAQTTPSQIASPNAPDANNSAYVVSTEQKTQSAQNEVVNASMPVSQNQNETIAQTIPSQIASPNVPEANVPHNSQLVVYYFHGDMRCPTCHKLENYAKQALETYFAEALAAGQILWQPVNVDRTENSHYVDDYKLITKSVILSETTDGKEIRWQNLDQIWKKVGNKDKYMQYIKDDINKFLEGKSQ